MAVIAIALIVEVIGLFLPWVKETVSTNFTGSISKSVTGYEINQGLISAGIALAGAIIGFIGSRTDSKKIVGFLVILSGIVIVIITASMIMDPGALSISNGPFSISSHDSLQPGIYLSLTGGVLLLIGGLITAFQS